MPIVATERKLRSLAQRNDQQLNAETLGYARWLIVRTTEPAHTASAVRGLQLLVATTESAAVVVDVSVLNHRVWKCM